MPGIADLELKARDVSWSSTIQGAGQKLKQLDATAKETGKALGDTFDRAKSDADGFAESNARLDKALDKIFTKILLSGPTFDKMHEEALGINKVIDQLNKDRPFVQMQMEAQKMNDEFDKMQTIGGRLGKAFEGLAGTIIKWAAGLATLETARRVLMFAYEQAKEAQEANVELAIALKHVGIESEEATAKIDNWANSVERTKRVNSSLAKEMIGLGTQMGLTIEESQKLIEVAADMGPRFGGVENAFRMLAQAADDDRFAMQTLGRQFNITVTEGMTFAEFLDKLAKKTNEDAVARVDTFTAAWDRFMNSLGNNVQHWAVPVLDFFTNLMNRANDVADASNRAHSAASGLLKEELLKEKQQAEFYLEHPERIPYAIQWNQLPEGYDPAKRLLEVLAEINKLEGEAQPFDTSGTRIPGTKFKRVRGYDDQGLAGQYENFKEHEREKDRKEKQAVERAKRLVGSTTLQEVRTAIAEAEKGWDTYDTTLIEKAKETYSRLATDGFNFDQRAEQQKLQLRLSTLEQYAREQERWQRKTSDAELQRVRNTEAERLASLRRYEAEVAKSTAPEWWEKGFIGPLNEYQQQELIREVITNPSEFTTKEERLARQAAAKQEQMRGFIPVDQLRIIQQEARQYLLTGGEEFGPPKYAPISHGGGLIEQSKAYQQILAEHNRLMKDDSASVEEKIASEERLGREQDRLMRSVYQLSGTMYSLGEAIKAGDLGGVIAGIGQTLSQLFPNSAVGGYVSAGSMIVGGIQNNNPGQVAGGVGTGMMMAGAATGNYYLVAAGAVVQIGGAIFGGGQETPGHKARHTLHEALSDSGVNRYRHREMGKDELEGLGILSLYEEWAKLISGYSGSADREAGILAGTFNELGLTMEEAAKGVAAMTANTQDLTFAEAEMAAAQAALLSHTDLTIEDIDSLIDTYREGRDAANAMSDKMNEMVEDIENAANAKHGSAEEKKWIEELNRDQEDYIRMFKADEARRREAENVLKEKGMTKGDINRAAKGVDQTNAWLEDIYYELSGDDPPRDDPTDSPTGGSGHWQFAGGIPYWVPDEHTGNIPTYHDGKVVKGYPSHLAIVRDDEVIAPPEKFPQAIDYMANWMKTHGKQGSLPVYHEGKISEARMILNSKDTVEYQRPLQVSANASPVTIHLVTKLDGREVARSTHRHTPSLKKNREVA